MFQLGLSIVKMLAMVPFHPIFIQKSLLTWSLNLRIELAIPATQIELDLALDLGWY